MAPMNGNDTETPTFDPGSAFAWTLRSGEIALRERRRGQSESLRRDALASTGTKAPRHVNGAAANASTRRRYETPIFDPRSAFAWTLRSGEIARLERQQRRLELDVLLGAL